MAETLTENDDDLEIVEIDAIPTAEEIAARSKPVEDDDDDDHEDSRLAEGEDDPDGDIDAKGDSPNREKRLKRRQSQKAARDRQAREVAELRERTEFLSKQLQALQGNALDTNVAQIEQRLTETQREITSAEGVIAKAMEAGNGDDVVAAMKWRDEARDRAAALNAAKEKVEAAKNSPQEGPDPRVQSLAREWMDANPWYDSNGTDPASILTTRIDREVSADGYTPNTPAYWKELTRRVNDAFKETPRRRDAKEPDDNPRRKAPPQGSSREHAPASTRNEVYVTPERRKAMEEAGIWDDPVRRNKMLKTYQAYDRENTAK